MEELECTPLLDGVRKILGRSGGSEDSEFGGVVLRQVPVAQRVVPQEDIRGEVMDFIVQQIEDTDLSPTYVWAIAAKVANKISEAIPSNIQINALNEVARKELDSLCAKIEADPSILEVRSSSSSISVKALRNARRTMEDRHVIILDLNLVAGLEPSPHYEYFAVFDGHGGREAANYCAAHFHLVLAEQLRSGLGVPAAIEKAFKIVDGNFCDRALEMARKAGSTAVVALIVDKKTLHVGWLGDSEAVLARNGQAQGLVKPHKPSVVSEQERIERLGGEVINLMGVHRVNANLAVSRAVGDMEHKPFVSNDAEVTSVELDDSCDFIVLGCDGLFDLLSHQDVVVNAYHSALTRRFDTSVAENLTRAAISNGSTDNVTTIVVNLRDPKKWHFESVVFPKQEAASERAASAGKNLNGSSETAAPNVPLAGGDCSPVREVAAGFVSDTVEMALNKVNGAPPSNLDLACDLSPPEEEQRDLMASLKNDTPEADRLNPDAPEFVPSFPTSAASTTAPELLNQSSSEENTEATVITASPATESMPKSESRDELVYEIEREIGTAPQAVQAELVNLDASSEVSVSPPKAAEGLSDSDEDLNSMVVHEDQPQPEIKLSELIVREQHIHVIPEESPTDEVASPVPEAIAEPEPAVTQNGTGVEQLVDFLQEEAKSPPPTPVQTAAEDAVDATSHSTAAMNVEQVVDLVSGLEDAIQGSVQKVVDSPQVSEDLVDLASQVLHGDVLEQIEHSNPCKPACRSPVTETPLKVEDSQYLFSAEVGVHEEAIVPRAQPLLFDTEDNSTYNALSDAMDNLILDEAPKVVDAIEKPTEGKLDNVAASEPLVELEPKIAEPFDYGSASIELDSVKDVVEKLSAANEAKEEAVAAPIIPDSIPEAEGVQDVDSESDNDAQEWSFVKPVEQKAPEPAAQEAANATAAAAAAVAAATSVAAAVVASKTETPAAKSAAAETPKAAEKSKATPKAAKAASASKPSPRTPTAGAASAKTAAAAKASPKTATPLKATAKPPTSSAAPASKPATARTSGVGAAKTTTSTKAPAPKAPSAAAKPASARPVAAARTTATTAPKTTTATTTKAPAPPKPAASKPAPARPVASTATKTTTAASTRPAVSARAPATSAAPKAPAARPAATKPTAPKAPLSKPATASATSTTATSKTSSTAATRTTASVARTAAPKPAAASTGVKKTAASTATGAAAPSAARVAAARVAAARTAPKTTASTAATASSTAKPKTGAVKTTATTGTGKVAPKSPVKKAVKQEKKAEPAPAAAPDDVPKENGSANGVSQTNGHSSPHPENGSSDASGPVPTEAPAPPSSEGQTDLLA